MFWQSILDRVLIYAVSPIAMACRQPTQPYIVHTVMVIVQVYACTHCKFSSRMKLLKYGSTWLWSLVNCNLSVILTDSLRGLFTVLMTQLYPLTPTVFT